ncbi:MAG: DUF72 domain-containing protein [Thermoplasmatales archaeon]|nr:DUF72 domain-containing protein [Thermoplasmatales archaeon]
MKKDNSIHCISCIVKIGCCGFPVGMKKYFERFNAVEIQKTFYEIPEIKTSEKWREKAPKNFEFTLKANQVITHPISSPTYRKTKIKPGHAGFFKNIEEVFDAYEKTKEIAKTLRARIILFQCPPSFKQEKNNIENMYNFFSSIPRDFVFAWEPRGEWDEKTVKKICEELELVHCVDPFKNKQVYGDFGYFRLHGIGGYRYRYSDSELERLKKICKGNDYVFFNNVYMYEDALRFKGMIK